jgi:DNA-binding transcriptional ArsR family regulator
MVSSFSMFSIDGILRFLLTNVVPDMLWDLFLNPNQQLILLALDKALLSPSELRIATDLSICDVYSELQTLEKLGMVKSTMLYKTTESGIVKLRVYTSSS